MLLLVLIRHSIDLQLKQVGEILSHLLSAAAAATSAALLAPHLQVVELFGVLQEFQRAIFRGAIASFVRRPCRFFSAPCISVIAFGSTSAIFFRLSLPPRLRR